MDIPDGFLTDWCDTLATDTESPPEAYLATGLATVAAVVGPRITIRWSQVHRERCNLWILVVGRSALGKKTTGMRAARWAVRVASEVLGDDIRAYGAKRMSDAQMAMDLDVVSQDTAAAQEAEKARAKAEGRDAQKIAPIRRSVPVSWLMTLNEVAPLWGEGLREWLAATQSFLLDVYDGELASNTRQSFVPQQETFVTALGNIPPAELEDRTTLGLLTSGFAGRWMVLPSPGPRVGIPSPYLNGVNPMKQLAAQIEHMADLAKAARSVDMTILMPKGSEAEHCRAQWYMRHWNVLAQADATSKTVSARADLFGRLQATALKLAIVVAVSRQAQHVAHLDQVRVSEQDMAWAQDRIDESWRYLMEVVESSGGGAKTTLGKAENRIVTFLAKREALCEGAGLTTREIAWQTKGSDTHRDMISALEGLVSTGRVEMAELPAGPRGGRPGKIFWLVE